MQSMENNYLEMLAWEEERITLFLLRKKDKMLHPSCLWVGSMTRDIWLHLEEVEEMKTSLRFYWLCSTNILGLFSRKMSHWGGYLQKVELLSLYSGLQLPNSPVFIYWFGKGDGNITDVAWKWFWRTPDVSLVCSGRLGRISELKNLRVDTVFFLKATP